MPIFFQSLIPSAPLSNDFFNLEIVWSAQSAESQRVKVKGGKKIYTIRKSFHLVKGKTFLIFKCGVAIHVYIYCQQLKIIFFGLLCECWMFCIQMHMGVNFLDILEILY